MTFKSIACAVMLAIAPVAASALTMVNAGGSYDIESDNLFSGVVSSAGGAGSHTVNFFTTTAPDRGFTETTISGLLLNEFENLTVSWTAVGDPGTVYETAVVTAPTTTLATLFLVSRASQDLVFTWTDSSATAGFDFVVAAVPLPAGGLLLLTALGGMGIVRRRKKLAA